MTLINSTDMNGSIGAKIFNRKKKKKGHELDNCAERMCTKESLTVTYIVSRTEITLNAS